MITKVNNTNKDEYSVFFDKVASAIGGGVKINTLAEYFNRLETIKGLSNAGQYLVLPLDEPFFDIDTNSRNITVPNEFKRNGVGVVGDSMAESLFFRVDRYFDIQDLHQSGIQIYIQWETPAPNSIKGYSKPWLEDVDSQPGKLIFAWAIPSMLTKTAGNLKFSVRFQQATQSGDIVYDLSTLPQTVKINNGLNFTIGDDLNYQFDATNLDTIKNRLHNSTIGGVFVPAPTMYVCTPARIMAINTLTTAHPTQELVVSAYPADSTAYTSIKYTLSHSEYGILGETTLVKDSGLPQSTSVVRVEYGKTQDTELSADKLYYVQDATATGGYRLANASDNLIPDNAYELFVKFTIATAGTYRLTIVAYYNGIEQTTGQPITENSKETYHSWTFDKPTPFAFGDKVASNMATFNPSNAGVVNFSADASISLTALAPIDTDNAADQQNGAEYEVSLWRSTPGNIDQYVESRNLNNITITSNNEARFNDISTNGEYYVVMTKKLNNCEEEDEQNATSSKILITEALSTPVVINTSAFVGEIMEAGTVLSCTHSLSTEENGYEIKSEYQWYKSTTTGSNKPTEGPADGSNIRAGWNAIKGATKGQYVPTEAGFYTMVATVSRNGSLQRGNGPIFTVYKM